MASASIVITTITIILQIVLIALLLDIRKKISPRASEEKKPLLDAKKIPDGEQRFNKRSQNDHRNNRPPLQQNQDHVERSLRDINLRLKNAERDQEKERKRIKDSIGPGQQKKFDHQKPRDNNDNFRRNDRSRQDFHHNNRNSDNQRHPREESANAKNVAEIKEPVAPVVIPQIQETPVTIAITPVVPEQVAEINNATEDKNENLQHGRKVMVKRRVLNVEDEKQNESNNAQNNSESITAIETAVSEPAAGLENTPEVSENNPISFGR
jgi:hypothetical protein